MRRWTLTVVTVLLVALWLASGFPGVRWHWPDVGGKAGARQGSSGLVFGPARPTEGWTLWTVIIDRGQVRIAKYHSVVPEMDFSMELQRRVFWTPSPRWFAWPSWSGFDSLSAIWSDPASANGVLFMTGPVFTVTIPLWIPSLLTAIPAALLWRRRLRSHRRRRAGACVRCGYDLAGLPAPATPTPTAAAAAHGEAGAPTCPECGA